MDEQKNYEELSELEKITIDKIIEMTDDVEIPDKLLPENILDTISARRGEVDLENKDYNDDLDSKENYKENNKIISFIQKSYKSSGFKVVSGVAAAAIVLVLGLHIYNNSMLFSKNAATSDYTNSVVFVEEPYVERNASEEEKSMDSVSTGNISDYGEVYDALSKYMNESGKNGYVWYDEESYVISETAVALEGVVNDVDSFNGVNSIAAPSAIKEKSKETSDTDYSKTNVQTVGIDEADIIKTDGEYIYYVSTSLHTITIYKANDGNPEMINSFYAEGAGKIDEIYLNGNSMLLTGSVYRNNAYNVSLVKYDVTDKNNPKLVDSYLQEGYRQETRKIGDIVYIVSRKATDLDKIDKDKPETFIPKICGGLVKLSEIYLPDDLEDEIFTVISSVNTKDKFEQIDTTALLGLGGTFYMGSDKMYIYRQDRSIIKDAYRSYGGVMYAPADMTEIKSIDYDGTSGSIGSVNEGKIPGIIRDTFAINEYNGYLRVMTTSTEKDTYTTINNVFVLDNTLNVVGSIEGLAKGERIYSARYMGDVAYFVTFRETDPLYSVDLSNPTMPQIIGALKIPGFSEYLHNYENGMLLGIGMDDVLVNGYNQRKVKLSMFDVNDPSNVTEISKMMLEDADYAEALYNYKAVMIDANKNIFGFATDSYRGKKDEFRYRIFRYVDGKFVQVVNHLMDREYGAVRAVYIGDYVYIVDENSIVAYKLSF